MKKRVLTYFLLCFFLPASSQSFTASNLLEALKVQKQKFESYVVKQNFQFIGHEFKGDTIVREYNYRPSAKAAKKDSIKRGLTFLSTKEDYCYVLNTFSADEGRRLVKEFKKEGFYCNNEADSVFSPQLLYQHNDVTVGVTKTTIDSNCIYSFLLRKQALPKPKEIIYAEDLFVFNSHEYLRSYFGDENVKKDVYYLADGKVGKCSVLFANSNRQVVFLWGDDVNNCCLARLYIGGQLRTGSAIDYERNIAENIWQLKNGVHAGMSLYTLRILNDAAFNFYGGASSNTGMVFTDSTGKVNFKKAHIILGCMNCTDAKFAHQPVINSDDAIGDERILFVHTIIVEPDKKNLPANTPVP